MDFALFRKYKDIRITFVSAPELRMDDDVKNYLVRHKVVFEETEDMGAALGEIDVLYQTRMAKEWIKNDAEYERLKDRYIVTRATADAMKKGSIIIHPLPRVGEIAEDVDTSPHAVYFKQVGYGLHVRMAILKTILGGS